MSGLIKIKNQLEVGKYTVLILDSNIPYSKVSKVIIDGRTFKTEIVYDMPNSIGIIANGNFIGKEIKFI